MLKAYETRHTHDAHDLTFERWTSYYKRTELSSQLRTKFERGGREGEGGRWKDGREQVR